MAISSQQAGAQRLREAINAYCSAQSGNLDETALALFDRLAHSANVANVFSKLNLKDMDDAIDFLTICIVVEQVALRFSEIVRVERKMPDRLLKLQDAVARLRYFVAEQTKKRPSDFLSLQINCDPPHAHDIANMGLDVIDRLIEGRGKFVEPIMERLGATRKKHRANAAIIAAVRHLADGFRFLTGKPHGREIRELAPVIFAQDLPEETMTYALRAHNRSRYPLFRCRQEARQSLSELSAGGTHN